MDWNWACDQMTNGKIVYQKSEKNIVYWLCPKIYPPTKESSRLHRDMNGKITVYSPTIHDMTATDWQLYQEPKKWSKEQVDYAKALITFGGEYIACDENEDVFVFARKPVKSGNEWDTYTGTGLCEEYIMNKPLRSIFGNNVKWEDEQPTRLQDIVDSEVQE